MMITPIRYNQVRMSSSAKYLCFNYHASDLTHWGRVTHICVSKLTIIGSDNGLSPSRRQPIIWTNAGILLIRPWGTNLSEILIEIDVFSFEKMHLKMSSAKWRPFCLGHNVLIIDASLCHACFATGELILCVIKTQTYHYMISSSWYPFKNMPWWQLSLFSDWI